MYMLVGGMPNVVNEYIRTNSLAKVLTIQKAILDDDLYINQGALLENVCAEGIATRHSRLMYFERKSTLKIDFILNIDGKVTAIEVKSGKNKQAKSLK